MRIESKKIENKIIGTCVNMHAPTSYLPSPSLLNFGAYRLPFIAIFCFLSVTFCLSSTVHAAQKDWNAQGDGSSWTDDANWYPSGAPDESDDAKVDLRDAQADITQNFKLQSLTVGGKRESSVSISNFTTGTVAPVSTGDDAVTNRLDGHLVLKGSSGKLTLKGAYKDSEEVIPEEPSFLLYVA